MIIGNNVTLKKYNMIVSLIFVSLVVPTPTDQVETDPFLDSSDEFGEARRSCRGTGLWRLLFNAADFDRAASCILVISWWVPGGGCFFFELPPEQVSRFKPLHADHDQAAVEIGFVRPFVTLQDLMRPSVRLVDGIMFFFLFLRETLGLVARSL